jgi:hypothetical protein
MAATEFVANIAFSIFLEVGRTSRELLNLRRQRRNKRFIVEPLRPRGRSELALKPFLHL